MLQRKNLFLLLTALFLLTHSENYSQSMLDLAVGSSNADHIFTTIAYRVSAHEHLRVGIECQLGSVRYRFIEAKPMRSGYAAMISLPILYKLYETEHIRLDLYVRAGIRFQGIVNHVYNHERNKSLTSTALNIEPGLMIAIPVSEKFLFHSGVTFPNFVELSPKTIYENSISAVNVGFSYQASKNKIFFFKALTGPAMGADGDSQKYSWSVQAGLRLVIGNKSKGNPLVLESSY
jgi:hypothetical protein